MPKLEVFKTDKQKKIDASNKLLEDAKNGEFETIVILGIKDEKWEVFNSAHANGFKLLGTLEIIKLETFRLWGDDDV